MVTDPFPAPTPFPRYVNRCHSHGCRMIPTGIEGQRGIYCPVCAADLSKPGQRDAALAYVRTDAGIPDAS